jgi:hypothetical protein
MVTAGGIRLARFRSVTLVGCNKHRQIWQWHVGIVGVAYFGSSWRNRRREEIDKDEKKKGEREREGEKTNTTRFAPQMLSGGPRPPRSLVLHRMSVEGVVLCDSIDSFSLSLQDADKICRWELTFIDVEENE